LSVVHAVQTFAVQSRPFVQSDVAWQSPVTHTPATQTLPLPQLVSSGHGPHVFALQVSPPVQSFVA
jgi:hypothetical protein